MRNRHESRQGRSNPHLLRTKQARHHLRFAGEEWILPGSNRRPPECKSGALPTELKTQSGLGGGRTRDLPVANGMLSQLSHEP